MTSSVFFKFKSQKEPSRVEFDGTGISVFELKRDIIIKSGLGDGTDFDLAIYNEDGNEEYDDDTTIIPRSTSIIARRLPPLKPGAGRAARYMTGKAPVNAKNSSRKETSSMKSTAKPATASGPAKMDSAMTEEERMQAMFQAQSEQWSAQQEEMANQTPVFRPGGNKKGQPPVNVPDHEPPNGYICYRCGEKGHWIQVCPKNDDPAFDKMTRIKRTTGIPRSFLKTVEKPAALANDGTTDETKAPSGIMVNAEGEFVIAEPDKASWEQFQAKTKSSAAAQKAAALGDKELQDRGLECSIDKRIFIDPMKTPCCEKTYCNDCITNALIESDLTCPGCQNDGVLIDDLKPDTETSEKIKEYLAEKTQAKKEKEKERSKSPSIKGDTAPEPVKDSPTQKEKTKSPTPATQSPRSKSESRAIESPSLAKASVNGDSASKKRPADELLENPKIPKGPKAMQRQPQKPSMPMMNGMNPMAGFPSMPFDMSQQQFGNGFNMGMMPNFNGMAMPMFNPMMPMGNFPMNGNFNAMGNGMGNGMGYGGFGGIGMNGAFNTGFNVGFPNQQQNGFAAPATVDDQDAYFRKPVNPNRHQGRVRKARPSDYREL